MGRLATSFVLGYHGCDSEIAHKAVNGNVDIIQSTREFDWLGPGAYFWESDPERALEWADWKKERGDYKIPAIIGAVIDLGECLDLVSRRDLDLVKEAHESFIKQQQLAGLSIPENKSVKGEASEDRVLRYLDCAVIKHLHSVIDNIPEEDRSIPRFDTVRGMFTEGEALYPGCGFREKSHTQIAVRNSSCIKGIFLPR